MPPREKEYDAVCLVIDVGVTCFGSGYLDKAILCASEMVQRKIYSESNDRIGLILVGTQKSDNPLGYRHVMLAEHNEGNMVSVDFAILEYINKNIKDLAGCSEGDWLDGIIVAMDYMHRSTEGSMACKAKRVVVLTDMGCRINNDRLEDITEAVKREDFEFFFILPDWASDGKEMGREQGKKPPTEIQKDGMTVMNAILEASRQGQPCGIELAHAILLSKERRKKKPLPWKTDLKIGPDIEIPVTGYIHIRREIPKSWKRILSRPTESSINDENELKAETTFVRDNEDQEVVEPPDLIDAYKYGSRLCPMSEVERSGVYDGGPKSFIVVGFVKVHEVPLHLLVGDGCMVFQPQEGNEYSVTALSTVVEAMVHDDMVGIVRRVYRQGTAPRLGALIPEDHLTDEGEEQRVLVFIELPYMEDLRQFPFAPLWRDDGSVRGPSRDQLDAVDNLIDAMLLKTDDDNRQALNTTTLLNPYYQHLYRCLTHRALNPSKGRYLPAVEEHVKDIMEAPESIRMASKSALSRIKELFNLDNANNKGKKRTGDVMFGGERKTTQSDDTEDPSIPLTMAKRVRDDFLSLDGGDSSVTQIGTTTPYDDFNKLLKMGLQLNSLSVQIEKVILNLLKSTYGDQMTSKIISCLEVYRKACLELKQSAFYNIFVKELKHVLLSEKRSAIWGELVDRALGLIDTSIDNESLVQPQEAEAFLSSGGSIDGDKETTIKEVVDDEDLLDDL